MNYSAEEIPELRGYTVEWAEPGNFFLSRRNRIFHSSTLTSPFEPLALIGAPAWKAAASGIRLAQRLLRFMVTNVVPLRGGEIFVTFDRSVGVIRDGKYRQLGGLVRPCRVLRSACAVGRDGSVFFGEYLANDQRGEMRIYKYSPGADNITISYTFPPNSIKHVHGIYFDEVDGSLVCLTGDNENECRILRTDDEFRTVETIGEGDETWRAVSVLFSDDSFFYGMDAEFRTNHIYRVDRATGERRNLGDVDGTVFYSKRFGRDLFFATTAENAPAQKENVAAIWHTDGDSAPRQIVRYEKDAWHGTFFMFGTIHFPYNNSFTDKLFFSLVGVKGDNRTFKLVPGSAATGK
jgi:hypothetical protein